MATLGIFTVKSLHLHEGRYYTYGGFGRYLSSIRGHFERTVLIAHVRHAPPRPGDYEISQAALQVVGLPPIRNELQSLLTMPVQFWRCWKASALFDLAHARMPDYTGVVGAIVCHLRGKPVFCQIVDDWAVLGRATPWRKKRGLGILLKLHFALYDWCERAVSRGQLVFAQGETCFEKHRRRSDCRLVISSAHTEDDLRAPVARFTRPPFRLLTVARLDSVKNQELGIAALAELRKGGEAWELVLVGDGSRGDFLRSEAQRLGVAGHVIFVGKVTHGAALWRYYDEADAFLLTSRSEGTPKAVLEALARGLPVVASAVAGVPNLLGQSERGLLFPDNDVDALVTAVRRLRNDPALRERCAAAGYEFARSNTVDEQTRVTLNAVFAKWPRFQR